MIESIPYLSEYYFNSQTRSIAKRSRKRKHDSIEIVFELSQKAIGDTKERENVHREQGIT